MTTKSDDGVEVLEKIGHDRRERGVMVGGPDTSLAMHAFRDGDGNVFGHSLFLRPRFGQTIPLCAAAA